MKNQCLLLLIALSLLSGCQQKSGVGISDNLAISTKLEEPEVFEKSPILISKDQGLSWDDGSNLSTDIMASFIEPFGDELILATEQHHLYLSKGNISRWKRVGLNLPGNKINALHIADEEILIAVFKNGVFGSSDQGQSWVSYNENLPDLKVLAVLALGNELLVATDSGIYKSTQNRKAWKPVFEGRQAVSLQEKDGHIIAGCTAGVLLSTDEGENWEYIHEKGAIHQTAIVGHSIAAMYISNEVYLSDDWGKSWTKAQYGPSEGSYVYELAAVGEYLIMSNNYGIFRSTDQGKTWTLDFPFDKRVFFDFCVKDGILYGGLR
jgi:photosystem II stability/assembly factor-like uncharacterized protein